MARHPRTRSEGVVTGRMLLRAWGIMGLISGILVLAAYFAVLLHAGWHFDVDVSAGTLLHQAYLQATTASFAAIVFCQLGTAFAARTERVSLRSVGFGTKKLLLAGIGFELVFTAALVYVPFLQGVFGTAALPRLGRAAPAADAAARVGRRRDIPLGYPPRTATSGVTPGGDERCVAR